MKLLKQFIFLTVCGLMTVRGVVAMEEKSASEVAVVDEAAVVASESLADGADAAEASVPAGVLSEEQREFLRVAILCQHQEPTRVIASDFRKELIEHYDDTALFFQYVMESILWTTRHLAGLSKYENDEKKYQVMNDILSALVSDLCSMLKLLHGKKLAFKRNIELFSFTENMCNFADVLYDLFSCYKDVDLAASFALVKQVRDTLSKLVETVFVTEEIRDEFIMKIGVLTFKIAQIFDNDDRKDIMRDSN